MIQLPEIEKELQLIARDMSKLNNRFWELQRKIGRTVEKEEQIASEFVWDLEK
tara:strand:- start:1202 stop:1360 length:159 start_codon:yes stop_codon:yes gene_type:complete